MNLKGPSLPKKQSSSEDLSWDKLSKTAFILYQKGINGDKESVRKALELYEQLRLQFPDNNLIGAYYGSTLCLLGRDQTDSVERSANVIRGLKLLDQAVASDPDNFEIRVIRENICVNLPEMYFHRNATAVEDCEYLIACYEQYPADIPVELYFQFLYNLSTAYRNLGKTEAAEAIEEKLCRESQDPRYKAMLATKGGTSGQQSTESFRVLLQPLPVILKEGERLHQAALTGGKADIQRAIDFFAKAQVLYRDNQLFKAYHADCMSLKGRIAVNTGEMFANAIKAIKAIDDSVMRDPDNIKIRFIRANHSKRLPELFFARTATAVIDLEYLAGCIKREPQFFGKEQAEEILYDLGFCYFRLGLNNEGMETWHNLSQHCSERLREKIRIGLGNNLPPDMNPNLALEENREEFYAEARRLHDLGVLGNKIAAQKSLEMWEKAYSEDHTDPVAEGFFGSSLALIGREAKEINLMFRNGIKGLKHLNQALSRVPDDWELRLLRAYLCYSLPEAFFHTTQQAIEDFQYLITAYEQNDQLFSKELYERIVNDLQTGKQRVE
jgi:tetratricopeptide (TPR) repeat protein